MKALAEDGPLKGELFEISPTGGGTLQRSVGETADHWHIAVYRRTDQTRTIGWTEQRRGGAKYREAEAAVYRLHGIRDVRKEPRPTQKQLTLAA